VQFTQELLKQLSDQKYALDQAAIVAATDAKGVITYVNEKFCEVSGYSQGELVGQTHRIVNSGYHAKSFFIDLWKTISSGKVWRGEVCNRKKGGELYWVYTTIVPFLNENGKPVQYLSIRSDITELKEAQEVITHQQEKLVAASRLSAIGEMAAAITHEINNPLGVILGRVEMLKSMLEDKQLNRAELVHVADTIEVTGQRIAKIIKSMKTMAHHQEEEPSQKILVSQILEEAMDLFWLRFQSHGVQFKKGNIPSNLWVECRAHQVAQVLVNLFNNSFDAIVNLKEKWIHIDVATQSDRIDIVITDSGHGIPEEVQKKMFNPFFSTKTVQYGTGLGLSISQGLLQKNGGELRYDGAHPHTRFIVSLVRSS
jgi:PAS domain S-box-containing protein